MLVRRPGRGGVGLRRASARKLLHPKEIDLGPEEPNYLVAGDPALAGDRKYRQNAQPPPLGPRPAQRHELALERQTAECFES